MTRRALLFWLAAIWMVSSAGSAATWAADVPKALALFREGSQLVEAGRYSQGIETFNRMLSVCGDNPVCRATGLFWLGRCHLELTDLDKANGFLDQAEALFSRGAMNSELATTWYTKGRVLTAQGRLEEALGYFSRAEPVFDRTNNRQELVNLYTNRALAYAESSEYDKALAEIQRAQGRGSERSSPKQLADLYSTEAAVYRQRQDYAKARERYLKAIELYKKGDHPLGVAYGLNSLGLLDDALSNYPAALAGFQESLVMCRRLGSPIGEALALNNIAGVHAWQGDYGLALSEYEEALAIARRSGTKLVYAQRLNNIGWVHLLAGDYVSAQKCLDEALEKAQEIKVPDTQALVLHNLAYLAKDQGRFKESFSGMNQAIAIAKKTGNRRQEAMSVLRLGNLYEYLGSFDEALRQYQEAERLQVEIGDRLFRSVTLADMANIFIREGRPKDAEEKLRAALALREELGVPIVEQLCRFSLYYLERFRYEPADERSPQPPNATPEDLSEALKLLDRAKQKLKPDNERDLMLVTYVTGRYLLGRNPSLALAEYERLSSHAERNQNMRFAFLGFVGQGLAREWLGQDSDAERAFRAAIRYAESIRETLDPGMKRTFLHGEEILGVKHVVPYEGLARVLFRLGKWDEAAEAADLTKARSFSENLVKIGSGVTFGVSPPLLESLETTEQAIKARRSQVEKLRLSHGADSAVKTVEKGLPELSRKYDEIKDALRKQYPAYYFSRFPEARSLAESRIEPDEWILSYDVSDTGVLIFLLHGPRIVEKAFQPINRGDLDAMVRRFRKPFETMQHAQFDPTLGKELYTKLIAPVIEMVPPKAPLTIIPSGLLPILPFEALVVSGTPKWRDDAQRPYPEGLTYLGDRHPLSYCQSIASLSLTRALGKETIKATRRLVIADPIFEVNDERRTARARAERIELLKDLPDKLMSITRQTGLIFERLPLTGRLGETLKELDPQNTVLRMGDQARRSVLLKEPLANYRSIVFATHGYFGQDFPMIQEPVLAMTLPDGPDLEDGLLKMSDVLAMELNADIVALTACQTGLGKSLAGEGVMSMGRAFQYAGAKSTLMSLWSVSEIGSVKLMERFFTHLKEGKPKQEALGLAREEIRKEGYEHPYYWAPFTLVGEAR